VRTLVTGATGFVGRHVVTDLAGRGDRVTAMVRPSSTLPAELADAGAEALVADLRRPPPDLASRLAAFDAVYHLAAGGGPTWRALFDANVTTTENLVRALADAGWRGRLVHVSSLAVYGFNQLPRGATVDESTPLEPEPGRRDDYAWTKLWQERVVRRVEGTGPELVIVRPGAIYGRERRFQYRLGRPLGEQRVLMLGGGNPMPLTHVVNAASLVGECGHHPRAAGQVFNCVDPAPVTQREYLRRWRAGGQGPAVVPVPLWVMRGAGAALSLAGRRTQGRWGPPLFLDPYVMEPTFRRFEFDTTKPRRVLGWAPPLSSEEGLRLTFAGGQTG